MCYRLLLERAPASSPRSPMVRIMARLCARASGATMPAASAVGAPPRSALPADQRASTAAAWVASAANGKAAMHAEVIAIAGAITLSGPTRSARMAAGGPPKTLTADCIAKTVPISTGESMNWLVSMKGSSVIVAPACAAQEPVLTSMTCRSCSCWASSRHWRSMCRTVLESGAVLTGFRLTTLVSEVQTCVKAAFAAKRPATRSIAGETPTAAMRAPPAAGPTTLPTWKAVEAVAIICARFSGELMSAMAMVLAPITAEALKPLPKRAATRCGSLGSFIYIYIYI